MASNPSTNSETGMMDTEIHDLEERLKSFMEQLQSESGIFERMVYKNKNQHRRCSYFQYLLKVRRDLRLLKLAKLEELVGSCFLVITGRKPKQKIHLLESLRWRKSECGTPNFMERLLGAARLLSQMVEPMLRAAVEVSTLLARSFFMGFSLTILALLARLRVLVQQILLDVVSVFNMVSSLSQKKQSVKITQEGIEVFREYFPTHKEFVTLACVWNTDKFVLSESVHKSDFKIQDVDGLEDTSAKSALRYQTLKAFLGDIDSDLEAGEDDIAKESFNRFEEDKKDLSCVPSTESVHGMQVEDGSDMRDNPVIPGTTDGKPSTEASPSATPRSVAFVSVKRPATSTPAFVSVKRPAPSPQNPTDVHSKGKEDDSADKEDSFFNLLSAGTTKASLF